MKYSQFTLILSKMPSRSLYQARAQTHAARSPPRPHRAAQKRIAPIAHCETRPRRWLHSSVSVPAHLRPERGGMASDPRTHAAQHLRTRKLCAESPGRAAPARLKIFVGWTPSATRSESSVALMAAFVVQTRRHKIPRRPAITARTAGLRSPVEAYLGTQELESVRKTDQNHAGSETVRLLQVGPRVHYHDLDAA